MISNRLVPVALAVVAVCAGTLAQAGSPALGAGARLDAAPTLHDGTQVDSARPARSALVSSPALPAVPAAWPSTKFELGLADAPGGAAALHAKAAFGFRYQYLAGGVNTGNGWATWNTNGQFVSYYVADSAANNMTPVFPYYMLLQSNPVVGGDEKAQDLAHLANPSTMAAYYNDLRLFFARAAGTTPVVLHVEPDLWGYIEQATGTGDNAATVPASVASSGDSALADLPNNAMGFARAIVRLRDQLAPNVILAYHLSVWGTNWDISYSNNSNAEVDALAARAAAFYASLGASFDIAFTDIGDRDADFKKLIYGDGGAAWWDDADFARYARFVAGFVAGSGKRVVVWQIPLGNTKMLAQNDTWGHYQDNRVEWFLQDPSGTHLAMWRDAGAVGLLFGGGAGGTTCACDAQGDGVTNPAAINNNTRSSLNGDDDGGYFHERAAAYYAAGALTLVGGSGGGGGGGGGGTPVAWTLSAIPSPTIVARRHSVTITTRVKASLSARGRLRVDVYGPTGLLAFHKTYAARMFRKGITVTVRPSFIISSTRRLGRYRVRVRIFSAIDGHTLVSRTSSRTFRVRA
jgi:hypothetical protein